MDLVSMVTFLVKNIVNDPEAVRVKQFDDVDDMITIEVLVASEDMGRIIGKNGTTANAIRTLVQTASYAHQMKKVKINFDSF